MYRYEIAVPYYHADDSGSPTVEQTMTYLIEAQILGSGFGFTRIDYGMGGWMNDSGIPIKEQVYVYVICTANHDKIISLAESIKYQLNQQSVYVCRTKADVFFI